MKIKYLLAASVAGIAGALVLPAPVQAQQITSGVEGRVLSDDGSVIQGATVVVRDERTGQTRMLTTGSDGYFRAESLTTGGPYTITATAPGYEGQSLPEQALSLQGNTSYTFRLTSSAVAGDVIVVTSARVAITEVAVGPGTSFSAEVLENAPTFNRDVRDIIRLDPRVSLDRDDGGSGQDRISCLGGNDRGNAFTVDGIGQGDIYGLNDTGFSSRSSTPIPYDAVRETQVAFAPFDVDYGQFTGCAINVVTKSGTNDYHFGGFYEYADNGMRGDKVEASGEVYDIAPIEADKRWGVYLGGPVIKDRLFLFGAYEHQEAGNSQDEGPAEAGFPIEIEEVTLDQFNEIRGVLNDVYGIDTGDMVTSRPFKNDRYFVRGDLQINDDHRFEATYQRLEESSVKSDDMASSGTFNGTVVGMNTFSLSGTKSDYYSARLYSDWSDKFSTEVRYSHSSVQDLQDPIGGGEAQSANPIPRIIVGVASDNGTGFGAVEAGPGFSRSANDLKTKIDQYRVVGRIDAGAHQLKIGAELNRADLYNLFVQNATGTLIFKNVDDLREGILADGSGTTNSPINVVNGNVSGAFGNYARDGEINNAAAMFGRDLWSIFAQDDWQATDRLGITAGVRVDWYDGDHPDANPNFADRYGFANTASFSNLDPIVMPRIAATFDLDDFAVFSRSQLRAGVGIFSGGDPLVWFGNAFQNNGYGNSTGRLSDCPDGVYDVVTNGQFTGVPQCVIDEGAGGAALGTGDTQSIDPDLKMPSVWRANIGFASNVDFAPSGFFSNWHINLDYIYSKYKDALTVVDLSQTPNINKGLDGYTIDGRPIYAAIDPTRAGCDATLVDINPAPVWSGVSSACFGTNRDDELMLTNGGSYDSQIASFILAKTFDGGLFTQGGKVDFSLGYSYTDANDRRNMYNSTATSNFDRSAVFDIQNPAESRGFYSSKHNIVVRTAFKEEFVDNLATRLGITFVARSGRPYSLTFGGSGVFADSSSGADNQLVYLPTGMDDPNVSPLSNADAVNDLATWAAGYGCAKDYIGSSIARNTCSNDWYYDMDVSFSQELPGPGRLFGRNDKLKLYATMDNFLNFLDRSWNVQRRRNFVGLQDVASTSGVDSDGKYIITGFNGADSIAADNQVNFSSSVWRLKVGISYDF